MYARLRLKTVNLELILFGDTNFSQKETNVVALISLKLNDFTVFGMLHDGSVASKILKKKG